MNHHYKYITDFSVTTRYHFQRQVGDHIFGILTTTLRRKDNGAWRREGRASARKLNLGSGSLSLSQGPQDWDRDERTIGRADERTSGRADERTSGRADERTSGRADERTSGRADERTSGRADERTSGRADERTSGRADERTSGREDERTSGRADERTSGRADERTSGRADERTSGRFSQTSIIISEIYHMQNPLNFPLQCKAKTHSKIIGLKIKLRKQIYKLCVYIVCKKSTIYLTVF